MQNGEGKQPEGCGACEEALDELANALVANGLRFSRAAGRSAGGQRSLISVRVLANLRHGGALRVGELAARESVSQPTMTGIVNRLAADGLVERRSDASDGRASVIALTEGGIAELERSRAASAESVRPALATLKAEELRTLERAATLLGELADILARRNR